MKKSLSPPKHVSQLWLGESECTSLDDKSSSRLKYFPAVGFKTATAMENMNAPAVESMQCNNEIDEKARPNSCVVEVLVVLKISP